MLPDIAAAAVSQSADAMDSNKENVKKRCNGVLTDAGVSPVVSEFFADVAQCEDDITHTMYRMRRDLDAARLKPRDVPFFCSTIQLMSKNFIAWKRVLDELSSRRQTLPSLQIDPKKLEGGESIKALCSIQTSDVAVNEGDSVVITDATQPNKIKVRTGKGDEGYVPALSCLLPSPDGSALDAVDRIQIYMLMCWSDCDTRIKLCLRDTLNFTMSDVWNRWLTYAAGTFDDVRWESRVSRRLKRMLDNLLSSTNHGIDYTRLHKILLSLENELLSQKNNADMVPMIESIGNLDKAILSYQAFSRHWRLFRQRVKESAVRPIRLLPKWDPSLLQDPNRNFKYYEIKLTAEETTIKEEAVKVCEALPEDVKGTEPAAVEDEVFETPQKQTGTEKGVDTVDMGEDGFRRPPKETRDEQAQVPEMDDEESLRNRPGGLLLLTGNKATQTRQFEDVATSTEEQNDVDSVGGRRPGRWSPGFPSDVGHTEPDPDHPNTDDRSTQTSLQTRPHPGTDNGPRQPPVDRADIATQTSGGTSPDQDVELERGEYGQSTKTWSTTTQTTSAGADGGSRVIVEPGTPDRPFSESGFDETMVRTTTTTTERVCSGGLRVPGEGDQQPTTTTLVGGSRRQSIDAEELVMTSHEENRRFFVRSVVDPRSGRRISIDEAVSQGIVDRQNGLYVNPATGASSPIVAAMNDGRILVEHIRLTRTPEKTQSIGLITIRTQTVTSEYTVSGAVDVAAGKTLSTNEATERGILNEVEGSFVNTATGEEMTLNDAIEAGLVMAQFAEDQSATTPGGFDVKTYAVSAVVDQVRRRTVPFNEAVRRGLVDPSSGSYVNNMTGERVFAGDAVRRGFYKSYAVADPSSLLDVDSANRVVVDRIDRVRKNVMRGVQVVNAFKRAASNGR